ncbi:MAG: hypothetical protein JNK41_14255 [Saprospiraceae bacterium]|jgi:hypothetical protein|nr:hypothetical protein [Saprospiraceae bacterium]
MENTAHHKSSIGWIGSSVFLLVSLFLLQDANHAGSDSRLFVSGFLVLFFTLTLIFSLVKRND